MLMASLSMYQAHHSKHSTKNQEKVSKVYKKVCQKSIVFRSKPIETFCILWQHANRKTFSTNLFH